LPGWFASLSKLLDSDASALVARVLSVIVGTRALDAVASATLFALAVSAMCCCVGLR
jgi:hypothetical protein